jgi:hypothetical protein
MNNLFDLEDFKMCCNVVKNNSGKSGVRIHVTFEGYLQEIIEKETQNASDTEEVRTGQKGR